LGITIREEKDGSVSIYGVNEEKVSNADQMVKLLEKGGFNRTTASTLMNEASSRSHAIFTIFIEQHIIEDLYKSEGVKKEEPDEGFMTAKFFFVDLAGSERAKKTGATGTTFLEGVKINLGLLELGNVISALATIDKKRDQFITFRNSKLTRILQDCLGGNSNTYMIACVSPAESNFEESLNTLKYASKAMNIKNTPIINRDPQSALISQLRQRIFELEVENRKYKQMLNSKGVTIE
jgi:myosin heavy subunit